MGRPFLCPLPSDTLPTIMIPEPLSLYNHGKSPGSKRAVGESLWAPKWHKEDMSDGNHYRVGATCLRCLAKMYQ